MANLNSVQLKKQKKADEYRYVEMKGKDRQTEVLQKTTRTKKCDRNVILSS